MVVRANRKINEAYKEYRDRQKDVSYSGNFTYKSGKKRGSYVTVAVMRDNITSSIFTCRDCVHSRGLNGCKFDEPGDKNRHKPTDCYIFELKEHLENNLCDFNRFQLL
jgi:hypothetical protein